MDIDKLTQTKACRSKYYSFSTLLDIDKLTRRNDSRLLHLGFSTLLDIDKLTLWTNQLTRENVLVLCWILINLHPNAKDLFVSGFSTLLDIDKLTPGIRRRPKRRCFSTLLDIDKLTHV